VLIAVKADCDLHDSEGRRTAVSAGQPGDRTRPAQRLHCGQSRRLSPVTG